MPTKPPFPPHKTQADSPAAPFLFSEQAIVEITDEEKRHGRYTAARCPPELRRSIIALLKEGRSHREIARLLSSNGCGVSRDTVKAIHDMPEVALEVDRALQLAKLTGPKARRAMHLLMDRVIEHPGIIPGASLALAIRQFYEISQLEEGKAISIEKHREHVDIFASFQALTAKLKEKAAAESNTAKKTGLAGGKPAVIDQQSGEPSQVLELSPESGLPAPADSQSADPAGDIGPETNVKTEAQ